MGNAVGQHCGSGRARRLKVAVQADAAGIELNYCGAGTILQGAQGVVGRTVDLPPIVGVLVSLKDGLDFFGKPDHIAYGGVVPDRKLAGNIHALVREDHHGSLSVGELARKPGELIFRDIGLLPSEVSAVVFHAVGRKIAIDADEIKAALLKAGGGLLPGVTVPIAKALKTDGITTRNKIKELGMDGLMAYPGIGKSIDN